MIWKYNIKNNPQLIKNINNNLQFQALIKLSNLHMLNQSTQTRSILNNFITPQHTQRPLNYSHTHTVTRTQSKPKRIPIFTNSTNKKLTRNNISHSYYNYQEQLDFSKIINYDFCGCQNKMTPCDMIANTFLRNVSMNQMKDSYFQQLQKMQKKQLTIDTSYKKILFKKLTKNYPQIFYSHLNNLMQVIGLDNIGPSEFQCLAAIQYHCKIQYLTYFLFNDIKKLYPSKQKFLLQAQKQMLTLNTTFRQIRFIYNEQSLTDSLQKFINDYYNSIGANLIPISYYAKYIAEIYKKGSKFFIKIIINFVVLHYQDMKKGLKLLRINEVEMFRNFMRQLNFQQFINEVQ